MSTKAAFWNDLVTPQDDFTGNGAQGRYLYRFTQNTKFFLGGKYTDRHFDGPTENYKVYDGLAGYEHFFSPYFSLSLAGGYFVLKRVTSDDRDGYTYDVSLKKRFRRGSVSINSSSGWDEIYLATEDRGLVRYWSGNLAAEYQIMEQVNIYAEGSYRLNKDLTARRWETLRGLGGIRVTFLRRFSFSMDYIYAENDDDIDTDDYRNNRVVATLTISRPFRL
ncbi:MAG: hypothetical protein JRJ29_08120 [Deltaproteobacteria bacterium]|nr:hypothetical protein [Deltaproteobacteria bacterium]